MKKTCTFFILFEAIYDNTRLSLSVSKVPWPVLFFNFNTVNWTDDMLSARSNKNTRKEPCNYSDSTCHVIYDYNNLVQQTPIFYISLQVIYDNTRFFLQIYINELPWSIFFLPIMWIKQMACCQAQPNKNYRKQRVL